jgi:hypothetical protein
MKNTLKVEKSSFSINVDVFSEYPYHICRKQYINPHAVDGTFLVGEMLEVYLSSKVEQISSRLDP